MRSIANYLLYGKELTCTDNLVLLILPHSEVLVDGMTFI